MKQHAITNKAILAGTALLVGATSGALAGEAAPYVPVPAPAPVCGNPGWTLTAAALYLKNYDDSSSSEGEFNWGFRGSVGYERPDGLFFRAVGFWYESDLKSKTRGGGSDDDYRYSSSGDIKVYSGDLLIGDTFCPTDNTSLEISAGLRYGKLDARGTSADRYWYDYQGDEDQSGYEYRYEDKNEFSGWGPTVQIRFRRTLTDRIALYADFQQSILFGEVDETDNDTYREFDSDGDVDYEEDYGSSKDSYDTLASVSELRGGIEFLWGWNRIQNAYLRLGAEGQYWLVDSYDVGLIGGNAEVGFTF